MLLLDPIPVDVTVSLYPKDLVISNNDNHINKIIMILNISV